MRFFGDKGFSSTSIYLPLDLPTQSKQGIGQKQQGYSKSPISELVTLFVA